MQTNISKSCSDFLSDDYHTKTEGKLKSSHSREITAALFGYKSHAALLSEKKYPLVDIEKVAIFVPDVKLLEDRRTSLNNLPSDLSPSMELASLIVSHLKYDHNFNGKTWLYDSLENYVIEELVIENSNIIDDELSGVMAETNAYFEEIHLENAEIFDNEDHLEVIADGSYNGTSDQDKAFCGDKIDLRVKVKLFRIAGPRGFYDFEISASGSVYYNWAE